MRASSFWSCGLPAWDVPRNRDSRPNNSVIFCLRTCCGDMVTLMEKMACLRPGAEFRGEDCWQLDRMEALFTGSDREKQQFVPVWCDNSEGGHHDRARSLMIGRCLGDRTADRFAGEEGIRHFPMV
jgi:hypothetical protein